MQLLTTLTSKPLPKLFDEENIADAATLLKVSEADIASTFDSVILESGQQTLATMTVFPGILIVLFTILYFWVKNKKTDDVEPTAAH